MRQRLCIFVLTTVITCLLFTAALYTSQSRFLRDFSVSDWLPSSGSVEAQNRHDRPTQDHQEILAQPPLAATVPNTPSTTKTMLVLATMKSTNNSWLHQELGDMLEPYGDTGTAIYVADDHSAPLHTPANKGHEAMVYLTYIIDFYEELPEISIFLHGHPTAWHNNDLLDMRTSSLIRRLNHDIVHRDGYMNLRCHWNPGCADHLQPFTTEYEDNKSEEPLVKDAWQEVFEVGEEEVPRAIGQPCCSQFAVTRDRIRELPKEKYEHFRKWLLKTNLSDFYSGRMFEYFWQFILNKTPIFCPDPRVCYCEGYGVCFEDPREYDECFKRIIQLEKFEQQLARWDDWKAKMGADWDESQNEDHGDNAGADKLNMDHGEWLQMNIEEVTQDLERRKQKALAVGSDPAKRAAAIEAALRWGEPPQNPRDKVIEETTD